MAHPSQSRDQPSLRPCALVYRRPDRLGFRSYVRGKQLEQQVEIARQVQANLLPGNTQPVRGVEVAVEYQPAQEVGDDFYDTFDTGQGLALVIGDASGKGIPAALRMGVIHGAVGSSAWTDSRTSHERETAELNRLLCERLSGDRFASMFWSYRDADHSAVHYVNAGCASILNWRAQWQSGDPASRRWWSCTRPSFSRYLHAGSCRNSIWGCNGALLRWTRGSYERIRGRIWRNTPHGAALASISKEPG